MENTLLRSGEALEIPQELRDELKKPYGRITQEPDVLTVDVAVGDVSFMKLLDAGITPEVCIIDGKTKRSEKGAVVPENIYHMVLVENPPGMITYGLWENVKKALKNKYKTAIYVEGEEDLAVIPVIMESEEGTTVIYGMPDRGMCVVKVTASLKTEIGKLLEKMEVVEYGYKH